jgi:hypothetical protein
VAKEGKTALWEFLPMEAEGSRPMARDLSASRLRAHPAQIMNTSITSQIHSFLDRRSKRGAIGFSLVYLLLGGGLFGALLIFIVLKFLGS